MLLLLYHCAWTFAAIPLFPLVALSDRGRLGQKLGLSPLPTPSGKKSVWIHALSVGEVLSAIPLVKALRQAYPSEDIVFTVTTSQGMKVASKELFTEVKALLPMPFDFWWSVSRVAGAINPKLFLLVETDLWPGLMQHLKKKGVPTLLVNGRISPRTFRSYQKSPSLVRMLYRNVDLCFMQTDLDRQRLLAAGIHPQKVRTIGNVKFDRDWLAMPGEEHGQWLRQLFLMPEHRIWVAGSTHPGEDQMVLDVFKTLLPSNPQLRLIIAPRRLEHAGEIHRLSVERGLKSVLRTKLTKTHTPYHVLILDTMGELGRIYGIASISFVGGSLVPMGGHNLLEPASFGCPVLFGPHTQDFELMSELLIEARGGKRVKDSQELLAAMKELFSSTEKTEQMGRMAKAFVEMNRGALSRIMDHIKVYLGE